MLLCWSEIQFHISAWHYAALGRHVSLETFNPTVIYKHALCFCQKVGTKKSEV